MSTSMGGFSGLSRGATGKATALKGTGYNQVSTPNFTPEQMQLFQRMFGQVGPDSQLSKLAGGDQSQFEALEAPALKQFAGMQGNLASRFSGFGGPGSLSSRHSSGFQNSASQQAADFAGHLQSQRMNLQRQALQDLMGMSNQLLQQRPYEQFVMPKQKSFLQELGISAAQGVGNALPFLLL